MIFTKIDADTQRFKNIVKGRVRKDLKKFMSSGSLSAQQGKKAIKIPLPGITIPHMTFGGKQKGGTGMGGGELGDPTGNGKNKGPGKGKDAGEETSDHPYTEFTPAELAQILGEELQLPNIEIKGKDDTKTIKDKYSNINNVGPQGLRHIKRTYKEALKRTIASGEYNFNKPEDNYVIPTKPDFRYKAPDVKEIPEVAVLVMYLRDFSGSMSQEMTDRIKSVVFWTDLWLTHNYGKIASKFLTHDTVCEEVEREVFFGSSDGGGTRVSSGMEKLKEIIAENRDKNIYIFYFGDGENMHSDNPKSLEIINAGILPDINLFCYGQTQEEHPGDYMEVLKTGIKNDKFVPAIMANDDEVMKTMKAFLGTGR